jgi:integrase/recombinase XerD
MRVQRVLMPGSEAESWTVFGDDQVPLEPVERFLGYLFSIEKSPNTVKAYAHDLKDWFAYLAGHDLDWQVVTVGDVAGFVAWLRLPPEGRDGKVAVLPAAGNHCSAASVNRKLAALTSFCGFHARHGVKLAGLLTTMLPVGLDYWIWPGRAIGLGSSLSDLLGRLPGRALPARLPDGAGQA